MRRFGVAAALILGVVSTLPARGADDGQRRSDAPKNSVTVGYEYEDFQDDSTESWQFLYVEYSHKFTGFGSVVLRVNGADRFGRDGLQYEIDAYPKLGKGLYAYINVGVSDDSLFPDSRYGFQIYKSLPHSWEASIGLRYLNFDDATIIYTGSLGRYWGNWYATVTPFVVPDEVNGASASTALEVRRYRSSGDDYWKFRGSWGNAPDVDTLLQLTNRLDKWSVGLERQMRLGRKGTFLKLGAAYADREFNTNVRRKSVSVNVALKHRF